MYHHKHCFVKRCMALSRPCIQQVEVIMNIIGNVISGHVTGETTKQLLERCGKIVRDRQSLSINRTDTSIRKSLQPEAAAPPSKIDTLSFKEFVWMVADEPDNKIERKTFHCEIMNHDALKKEEESYRPVPVIRNVDHATAQWNYIQIKQDVRDIIDLEKQRIANDPTLARLIINMTIENKENE